MGNPERVQPEEVGGAQPLQSADILEFKGTDQEVSLTLEQANERLAAARSAGSKRLEQIQGGIKTALDSAKAWLKEHVGSHVQAAVEAGRNAAIDVLGGEDVKAAKEKLRSILDAQKEARQELARIGGEAQVELDIEARKAKSKKDWENLKKTALELVKDGGKRNNSFVRELTQGWNVLRLKNAEKAEKISKEKAEKLRGKLALLKQVGGAVAGAN